MHADRHGRVGDRLIVVYKLGKAVVEALAAVLVLLVAAHGLPHSLLHVGLVVHEHLGAKWSHLFQALLARGSPAPMTTHLHMVAAALAVDAASSLLEGWAVCRHKAWAPWLIVIATGGLIPIELVLVFERPSAGRIVVLIINAAIVVYMVQSRRVPDAATARPPRWRRRFSLAASGTLAGYLVLAYLVLPWLLVHRAAVRALTASPGWALDAARQPSDPLNVGLVGTRDDVVAAMQRAGWTEAQPLSRKSAAEIAADVLLHRSDPAAPVSTLYVDGRRQDLAFEQQVGGSPRRRHHVRFWQQAQAAPDGRPFWLGATTYDRGVGLARDTGEITHHIDPAIDVERDKLIGDLLRCGCVSAVHRVRGVGPVAPGGHVFTDGAAAIAVLVGAPGVGRAKAPM
jgi:uncharacterized membrane protein (DUF2068 family)